MIWLLAIWPALLVGLVAFGVGRPFRGGALTLAYFVGLSLIHVPGALVFLGPDSGLPDREETRIGFELTLFAMACFVAGAILARHAARWPTAVKAGQAARVKGLGRLGRRLLIAGIIVDFVVLPISAMVPSVTSLVASLGAFLILGLWLRLYSDSMAGAWQRTLVTLGLLPLIPLATLAAQGFLGYGVYWVLSVIAFLFVIARRRTWFYVASPVVIFLGLSLFVTYMGQRTGIREVVWQEKASLLDRLDRISSIVVDFQLLDLNSPAHLDALDARLNQNWLVGAAVDRHEEGLIDFAYGGTVPLWGFIPRAIWPGKPAVGGGREVVTDITGIPFGKGTSVGAGQVLEFYANFGIPGVFVGFVLLGFVLMRLDQGIMRALAVGDVRRLTLLALPGLTLLQPGGNLLEIVVGLVAAIVVARLLVFLKLVRNLPHADRRAPETQLSVARLPGAYARR